jgi:hypothetical protein
VTKYAISAFIQHCSPDSIFQSGFVSIEKKLNVTFCIGENKLGILFLSLGDLNLLKKSFGKIVTMFLALKVATRK